MRIHYVHVHFSMYNWIKINFLILRFAFTRQRTRKILIKNIAEYNVRFFFFLFIVGTAFTDNIRTVWIAAVQTSWTHNDLFTLLQVFLEPFQCKRLQEQRCRAFRQLQSYLSLELDGGHLLPRVSSDGEHCKTHVRHDGIGAGADSDAGWPVRMVRQRMLARKSDRNAKDIFPDILLDMPDLSNDWGTLN